MTIIINGKETSKKVLYEVKIETEKLAKKEIKPGLSVILVGSDPASTIYVKKKRQTCEKLGFYSESYNLEYNTTEEELIKLIDELNDEPSIHGILVQLPLPEHINEKKVIESIDPIKDVDGLHPINQGYLFMGDAKMQPCTPLGIIELLERYEIEISGKNTVIVGRSNLVGKPVSIMLLNKNSTVTICHSKTKNLSEITKSADILIAAIGKANFITKEMVKEGSVIIDVGINRNDQGKLVGDVYYQDVFEKVSAITPVPGGVGPMTIAMLMKNTLVSAKKNNHTIKN